MGVGATPHERREPSYPHTELEMVCKAIPAALEDAGLTGDDLDGFAIGATPDIDTAMATLAGLVGRARTGQSPTMLTCSTRASTPCATTSLAPSGKRAPSLPTATRRANPHVQ